MSNLKHLVLFLLVIILVSCLGKRDINANQPTVCPGSLFFPTEVIWEVVDENNSAERISIKSLVIPTRKYENGNSNYELSIEIKLSNTSEIIKILSGKNTTNDTELVVKDENNFCFKSDDERVFQNSSTLRFSYEKEVVLEIPKIKLHHFLCQVNYLGEFNLSKIRTDEVDIRKNVDIISSSDMVISYGDKKLNLKPVSFIRKPSYLKR